MPTPIVHIVDDDPAVRDSLSLMIGQEGMEVKVYDSAETFLASAPTVCRGCAIIDIRMPGMDGMQLQDELKLRSIQLPIIFLTGHGDIPMSVKAIKGGAVDFLTKPVTRDKLLGSVRTAIQAGEQVLEHITKVSQTMDRLMGLTDREREVMVLAAVGHSNKEIARRLSISHRTVEIHKAHVMHKTGAANLVDLARLAQEAGLVE